MRNMKRSLAKVRRIDLSLFSARQRGRLGCVLLVLQNEPWKTFFLLSLSYYFGF